MLVFLLALVHFHASKLVTRCSGHQGGIYALQFTPDGATLATGGFDGTIRLYDMTGKLARSIMAAPIQVASK